MRSSKGLRADRRLIALLMIAVLVAAACGSTASQEEQAVAEVVGDDDSLSLEGLPEGAHVNKKGQVVNKQGEVIGTAEEFGLTTSGGTVGSSSGTTGASGTAGGGGPTGGGGTTSGALGPGITSSKIYVAVAYSDAGAANEAAFGTPLDADARKPYNAMIEIVNKAGGILGREIEPLYYKFEAASSETIDQQAQAACAYWTQDNKVFAFLAADASGILQQCAEKAGAVMFLPDGSSLPEDFQKYPHFIEISGLNLIRVGDVTVKGLNNQNYFGGNPKLGIVTWDDAQYRDSLERGFVPALARAGVELATDPAYATPPQTAADLAATSADINSAVLRFQSQGITHVMILDGSSGLCAGGCLTALFTQRADQQEYYPRYGFNANNQVIGLMESGLVPPDQVRNSIAVEWSDMDEFYDEGWRLNKTREHCEELMRDKGVPMENVNQHGLALFACQQFWFFQTVVAKLGGAPLQNDNFMAGVNTLGRSFPSTTAYEVNLTATQHDGVAAARNMKFVNSCECFKWTSKPYRV